MWNDSFNVNQTANWSSAGQVKVPAFGFVPCSIWVQRAWPSSSCACSSWGWCKTSSSFSLHHHAASAPSAEWTPEHKSKHTHLADWNRPWERGVGNVCSPLSHYMSDKSSIDCGEDIFIRHWQQKQPPDPPPRNWFWKMSDIQVLPHFIWLAECRLQVRAATGRLSLYAHPPSLSIPFISA